MRQMQWWIDRGERSFRPIRWRKLKKRTKQENHGKYFSGGLCGFHLRAPVRAPGAPGAPWVPETCGGKRDQQRCWQWADMDQSWTNVGRWSYIERLLMSPESCDILKQNNWFKRFSRYSMSCRLPKKQRKLERTESGEGGSRILMVESNLFLKVTLIAILRETCDRDFERLHRLPPSS